MEIALFADSGVLPGLHVTLFSALQYWGGTEPPAFTLFHNRLTETHIRQLRETLGKCRKPHTFTALEFRDDEFRSLPGMHGSHNIYGRLLLPQLLPVAHRVLYLDSDIVVGADLNELANVDLQGYALAAVSHTSFRWSLESELCAELNFDLDAPNFNTGVILLDAKKWRANKLTEICLEFAHNNTKRLWGDQTVLNCVFYKSFKILDPRWNRILRGHEPAISVLQNTIYHFVGVPKPFDVLGDRLHSNYNLFRFFLDQTALKDWRPTSVSNLIQLKRNFLMGPAICRKIWRRFLRRKK